MWTVELHSFSKMRERKTVVAWGCLVGSGAKLRKVRLSDAFSLGFQYIFLMMLTYFDHMLRSFPLDEQPAWPTRLQHPGGDSQRHVWDLKRTACYAQATYNGLVALCWHCHRLANGASRTSTRREAAKKPPAIDPSRVSSAEGLSILLS